MKVSVAKTSYVTERSERSVGNVNTKAGPKTWADNELRTEYENRRDKWRCLHQPLVRERLCEGNGESLMQQRQQSTVCIVKAFRTGRWVGNTCESLTSEPTLSTPRLYLTLDGPDPAQPESRLRSLERNRVGSPRRSFGATPQRPGANLVKAYTQESHIARR
eukprot:737330-Prorocentrum_minimum.AAC.3